MDKKILVLALARASDAVANSFLIIILPIYIGTLSLGSLTEFQIMGVRLTTELYIGIILSIFGIFSSLLQPFFGSFSDKYEERKKFVMIGITVLFITTILYPLADSYFSVFVIRVGQGIGAAVSIPATVALVNEYSSGDNERGSNFGLFNSFRLIGFGSGPIVAGLIYSRGPYDILGVNVSGLNASFSVAAFGALGGLLLVSLFVEDSQNVQQTSNSSFEGGLVSPVVILAMSTFILAVSISIYTPLEKVINDRLDQSALFFGIQFSAAVLANVLFQVPVGKLSDRVGRKPVILVGLLIAIPSVFSQGFITDPIIMTISRFVLGLSVALVFPVSLALAGDVAGQESGSVLSIITAAFGLGVAIGPLSSGILFTFGGFSTPFVVSSLLVIVVFFITYIKVPTKNT